METGGAGSPSGNPGRFAHRWGRMERPATQILSEQDDWTSTGDLVGCPSRRGKKRKGTLKVHIRGKGETYFRRQKAPAPGRGKRGRRVWATGHEQRKGGKEIIIRPLARKGGTPPLEKGTTELGSGNLSKGSNCQ